MTSVYTMLTIISSLVSGLLYIEPMSAIP